VRLEREWRVPVEVANDGDVTALAAHLADGATGVLGVAMGSSEAAGYIDRAGHLTGRLNELAFAPADLAPDAPADEWSGDTGVGAMYFSQQAVNRLARHFGLHYDDATTLPDRLVDVQRRMADGDAKARAIYETVGTHLGHAVAWYREFYDFGHMLVLGRVTTGSGGDLLLATARATLAAHYPDVAATVSLRMPDEKSKRLGQAVAAAALARNG
jgi:predicted NBD/HSP70 family sugar kinase